MKFVSDILKCQSGKVMGPYIIGCVAMTVTLGSGDSSEYQSARLVIKRMWVRFPGVAAGEFSSAW